MMAFRPFSLLLLLLLVMIPAQASWSYNFFDECEQPDRICVFVDNKFRETSADLALIKWWSPTPSYAFDGVVVDKSDGKKWVVKNKVLLESRVHIRDGCEVKFWSALISEMNKKCTDYDDRKEFVKNGMRFVPFSYDSNTKILIYEMVVEAGREPYVADYMELYMREPTVRFGLYKYDNGPKMSQYSPALVAFTCGPLTDEAPDPRASKSAPEGTTAELRNKYTCPGGTLMFIGGTNIGLQEGYCSQGGWRKTDRKLIFEQPHEKRTPYCWKETIFTECSKNRCYFFNNPDAPTEVTTDQSRAPAQLGVYVEYDTDDKWYVQIATKRNEPMARVLSFTIGNNSNIAYQSRIDGNKVSATLVRYDSGAVTGSTLYKFKLEAKAGEADKDVTKDSNGALTCDTGFALTATYGAAMYRFFGPATCVKNSGWTGINAKEEPPGTADGHIVNFADNKAVLNAKCVEVCKGVKNADTSSCEPLGLCKTAKQVGNTLSCDPNYRLVLNDINTDGIAGVTTRNAMTCTNEGWMEGSRKIVDFKDPNVDITKPVEANKCHPDFITFTNEEACPTESECSKPIYDPASKTLKCSDATEVLVLEHNGELKESFPTTPTDTSSGTPEAKCDNSGWTANGQKLFDMSASDYLNFHVKARCEQLCRFNLDQASLNAEPKVLVYDSENKTLTCNGIDKMLALDGVGVYSDLICSKDGWKTDKPEAKVTFAPIMAPVGNDATKNQKDERAKKFTCIPNNCMRPLPCKDTDDRNKCINPDFEKKKYIMSCESPLKLALKDGTDNAISYDYLRCTDGEWKDASGVTVITPLSEQENANPPAFKMICNAKACTGCKKDDLKAIESSTDANLKPINWNEGSYITCSFYKCGTGLHYAVQDPSEKFKYYHSKGEETIKCKKADTNSPSVFSLPDDKEIVQGKVGCVQQIPCNEYRPLKTDCEGCDSDAFQQKLKIGSIPSPDPVKCDTLGQMYYRKSDDKKGWKIVNELKCTKTGEWEIKLNPEIKPEIIPETMLSALPHIICSISDPNPQDEAPKNDRKTATCAYCPYPPVIDCKECKNAQDHATATNNGDGKCIMKIINGRFKFNGEEEIDKSAALVCQNVNGEYAWLTPDGKKVDTLAVIMNEMDNISTGAIAGIVIGVILLLGLIVFGMVYVAIRKRRAKEQTERLKSKGLEQKIDSIIEGATVIDDTKTLVL